MKAAIFILQVCVTVSKNIVRRGYAGTTITTIKYSPSGVQQWVSIYRGCGHDDEDAGWSIATVTINSATYVYVCGHTYQDESINGSRDFVTLKIDASDGSLEWDHTYNGTANGFDEGHSIAVDYEGNAYVTGHCYNSGSGYDYLTIKYNSNGVQQWAVPYDNNGGTDLAKSLAFDPVYNRIYVTGSSNGDIVTICYNSSGVQQWLANYDSGIGKDIAVYYQQGVFVTGQSGSNIITLKYTTNGTQSWVTDGGAGSGSSIGLYPKSSGEYYCCIMDVFVTGEYSTSYYGRTIKYNNRGTQIWLADYATYGSSFVDLGIDANENIYVTGLSGDSRYLTVKYNSAGVQQWYNHYSGPGEDPASIADAIAVDTYGNSFITGMHFEVSTVQAAFYTTLKYTSSGGDNFTTLFNNNGNLNKPETFSLSQNYPNPFNPVTNIIYSIPVNGLVCLTVYNMLGQEVTKLVNENKHAGSYNVTFDGTNLSSGIYFYDITAGDYMERKKMVLLK